MCHVNHFTYFITAHINILMKDISHMNLTDIYFPLFQSEFTTFLTR